MRIKNKLLSFAAVIACTANVFMAGGTGLISAGAETYNELTYRRVDENSDGSFDYVVITDCVEEATSIKIPDKIGGVPVKVIEGYAFENCVKLSKLSIPDSVTSIGDAAFIRCSSLKSITIPDGVKEISYTAFSDCKALESVNIPDSVTIIESSAFKNCESIETITIPNSVEKIGDEAFHRCTSLNSITILNPKCSIFDYGSTISHRYDDINFKHYFDGTICGFKNSTAQAYAERYGYKFLEANDAGVVGDANGDGNVTALDASMIFSEYKSVYNGKNGSFTQNQKSRCDMNGDNKITALDASKVFSIYKGNDKAQGRLIGGFVLLFLHKIIMEEFYENKKEAF